MIDIIELLELNILFGIKVGKTIDKNTREFLLKESAKKISEISSFETYENIYKKLTKIKKIKSMTRLNRFNTWKVDGMYNAISKNIHVVERVINNAKNGKIERVIIHEFIHSLQNARIFYEGKSIKGIIEGCTESYTSKLFNQQKSQVIRGATMSASVNYPKITTYVENVSIINQLNILLDNNLIEKLTLQGKADALKEIRNKYGKDFFEKIRKGTNKMLKLRKIDDKIRLQQELQNMILSVCYTKKYKQIKTIKDGEQYLEELKRIKIERFKIDGDTTFEDFYNEKYNEIKQRFCEPKCCY